MDSPTCAHHRAVRRQFRWLSRIWLASIASIVATHTLNLPALLDAVLHVLAACALGAGTLMAVSWSMGTDEDAP